MAADGHLRWGAPTRLFGEVKPEAVVHFAEHRSTPFSMIDREHAVRTQVNNVGGRLNVMFAIKQAVPDCHRTAMDTQTPTGKPTRVGVAAAAWSALKGRVRPQWPRAPRFPHDEQTQAKSGNPPVVPAEGSRRRGA